MSAGEMERQFRRLIAELELLSHGNTQKFDQDGSGRAKPGSSAPSGNLGLAWQAGDDPPHISYRRRWENAHSEKSKREIVEEIQELLRAHKLGLEPHTIEYGSPKWKRHVAESDKNDGELARLYNVSRQYIREVRKKYAA